MSIVRSNFSALIAPGLRDVFDDEFKNYSPIYTSIANVNKSTRQYEDYVDITGIGYLAEKSENASLQYEDPLQGYKTRITNKTYAKGIQISFEAIADDLYNSISNNFRRLSRAAVRTADLYFFDLFRGGFTTTKTSYGDAKPLTENSGFKIYSYLGKVQRWITLNKQAIAVQLQRLSEWTSKLLLGDAIVRTLPII